MKKIFLLLIILGFVNNVKSQEISRNNVYVELGGATMMYSVNYERLLSNKKSVNFPIRIGLNYASSNVFYGDNTIGIPVSFSFIKNLNKNFYFEARAFVTSFFYTEKNYGQGGSVLISSNNKVGFIPGASIGFIFS